MADNSDLALSLDLLEAGGYRTGDQWHRVHDIAQAHEGEPLFDRLHALCHRIEGDDGNARYWYRRAGSTPFNGSFEAEAQAIRADAGIG